MASVVPISLVYNTFESTQCTKESKPIIFLHGIGCSKEHWTDIPKIVAEETHRKVYVVDARNHGDSEWSDEFNLDITALDLLHFMDQIEAETFTIVGHSMGGITCMKTALKMPSKIDKMVIEDVGVIVPDDIMGIIRLVYSLYEEAVHHVPPGSTIQNAKKFVDDFVVEHLPEELKQLISEDDNTFYDFLKQNSDGSFNCKANLKVLLKALENKEALLSEYKGIFEGPTCFIYGGKSIFPVLQDAENIKRFFPNSQFVEIENATHDVHTDEPVLFTEALLKFLNE